MTNPGTTPPPYSEEIPVCCAILEHMDRILIAQRGHGGSNALQWEFPGGKQEAGESPEQCLAREIREELSVEITILKKLPTVRHRYPDKVIALSPFVCRYNGELITALEHQSIRWIRAEEIPAYNWSAADIKVWQHYLSQK